MCEPTTLTVISLVAMGLSAAGSAYAAREQGQFANEQARAQAAMANRQAADAKRRGAEEEAAARAAARRLLGEQKAAAAASGIDLGGGSVIDALSGTAWMAEQDAARIRYNAALEAWGYKAQSQQAIAQGKADAAAARTTMFSSIVGGAAEVSGGVARGYQSGVFKRRTPGS